MITLSKMYPIESMYGILTYRQLVSIANLVKYAIHGYSGYSRYFLQYQKHVIGIMICLLP